MNNCFHKKSLLLLCLLFVFTSISVLPQEQKNTQDIWKSLRFLEGEWVSIDTGQPQMGSGFFNFKFDLNENVLVRENTTAFPPRTPDDKPMVHEDLMIIYPAQDGAGLKAIYFDNEKHTINYTISSSEGKNSVIFESENAAKSANSARFRLIYALETSGFLSIEFQIAPPGADFKSYLKGLAKRK
jgi:hypothetical protein